MNPVPVTSREISRLTHNHMSRIALLIVALVPLLYGALYLWAFWDPYAHVDALPVALVVLDKPAMTGGETLTAGRDLADELEGKESFAWDEVTADAAARGLANGRYYMTLTIPADFSADLASAEGDSPVDARIIVARREGTNYLASQIGSRVFSEIRSAASASASKSYLDTILLSFTDVHGSLHDAALGAEDLAAGLETAQNGAGKLASGAGLADAGARDLSKGVTKLAKGAEDLDGGARKLSDGARTLNSGLARAAEGSHATASGAQSLAAGAGSLSSGLENVQSGATSLTTGSNTVASSSAQLAGGISQLSQGAASLAAGTGDLAEGADTLAKGTSAAKDGISTAACSSAQVAQGAAGVTEALNALLETHPELADDESLMRARALGEQVKGGTAQLAKGLDSASSSASKLVTGAEGVAAGAAGADAGARSLAAGLASATDGSTRLAAGAGSLASGAIALEDGVSKATAGSATLVSGASSLAAGSSQLDSGIHTAAEGGATLVTGSRKLAEGTSRLRVGATSATRGAGDLASGVAKIAVGSRALANGLEPAVEGSNELAGGLTAGVDDLPTFTDVSRMRHASMMSDPVKLENNAVAAVPNYGTGFAPYFIPLSVWVGTLVTFLFVAPLPEAARGESAARRALAGWTTAALVGVVQATLLVAVVVLGLGLEASSPGELWAMVMVTALVFVAVQQLLNAAFGPGGKFLAIVLLMLQLTSAAGTFPIEMQPAFFQTLHPYLPMTYVVSGLRIAISGGSVAAFTVNVAALVFFGVMALALTTAIAMRGGSRIADSLSAVIDI